MRTLLADSADLYFMVKKHTFCINLVKTIQTTFKQYIEKRKIREGAYERILAFQI